ncbi:MAG: FecR family protein [Burkholderiales bacterium]
MAVQNLSGKTLVLGALGLGLLFSGTAAAEGVAQIKTSKGTVVVERGSQSLVGDSGMRLQQSDVVRTGSDGSAGITFTDNTLMSVGPNSVIALDRYAFDSTTHEGRLEASLRRGTLSVVSGKIARQSPDAMTVKTPATILGVRGTEFFVQVGEAK